MGWEFVICRRGELTSLSRFARARSAGDERKFNGEDDGGARRGVPLLCDDAASFCNWAAAGSGGLEGSAWEEFLWDVLLGVPD